jgi:exopolyphosphatase/guanosine-5'-triphosphate,3'-diphosphate pyrophosphatase
MKADRADVICGGVAILMGLMQELGIAEIMPVEAGLRMGLIWDLHLRFSAADRREQAVQDFAQRFRVDPQRSQKAASAAETLYAEGNHRGSLARLVSWAGMLHEVGNIVSPTGFHKHGAYMLENADMPGFSGREQRRLAQLVLGQKGNLRKLGNALDDADFARAVLALRLAAVLLHAHETDAAGQFKLKMNGRAVLEVPGPLMQRHPTLSWWLARERGEWEEIGIPFVLKAA